MAKYFEIQQINATGNGHITVNTLVIDPVVKDGAIYATRVGVPDRFENDECIYKHCEPAELIVLGNAICIERKNPFSN